MILFEWLRYKNFLSTGNVFTEIHLNGSPSTLVVGANGAGKSTFIDALSFVLYGKAHRNINKPQLVNSITKKKLLVEIEFKIGSTQYLVRRGIDPDVFEVHVNGVMQDQEGSLLDQQGKFEREVLKMNYKSFCQIVILGSTSYTPFMKLEASDRREIMEDLLDLQVFSKMNVLLKDRASQNRDDIKDNEKDLALVQQKLDLFIANEAKLQQSNKEMIDLKMQSIKDYEYKIKVMEDQIDKLELDIVANESLHETYDQKDRELIRLLEMQRTISEKHKRVNKDRHFFKDHDHCPTCSQIIEVEFKKSKVDEAEKELEKLGKGVEIAATKRTNLELDLRKMREDIKTVEGWKTQINDLTREISSLKSIIQLEQTSIGQLEAVAPKVDESVKIEMNDQIAVLNTKKHELQENKKLYEMGAVLLKDTGIKARIIKQYIPIINKLVNKYLSTLDFFVAFELDEKFKEKIKSRFRDEFSYASFSEGEKLRIDLALLFTWRAIAKLRNSSSTNLLILDEVFDSSLDWAGTDEFMKMIKEISQETNVFVISHKGDALTDKFNSIMKFEKVKNFSKVAS